MAEPRELVLLAFAKMGLDQTEWQSLVSDLLNATLAVLGQQEWTTEPQERSLDGSSDDLTRVREIIVSATGQPLTLQECTAISQDPSLVAIQQHHNFELVIQPASLYRAHREPGLAVFDMDSTLIQQEVIDELARFVGVYDRVAAITEAAMRGEPPYTDFEASLRARVALLKGVPETVWAELRKDIITFTPGVRAVCAFLKAKGWKLAVLSGGFTPLANWVKMTLGLDYAHANFLESEHGFLTGNLVEGKPIVHAQRKQDLLLELTREIGLTPEKTIAVGDGSNDLLMMKVAGLGVAFNAKPKVQSAAPTRLNGASMLDLLHILGYTQQEIDATL